MKFGIEEKKHIVQSARSEGLSDVARANIAELLARPNRTVDTSDIPELSAEAWKDAVRGRFYRPRKEAVSLRLDADVLAWLKKDGQGYQTRVNLILREMMLADVLGSDGVDEPVGSAK